MLPWRRFILLLVGITVFQLTLLCLGLARWLPHIADPAQALSLNRSCDALPSRKACRLILRGTVVTLPNRQRPGEAQFRFRLVPSEGGGELLLHLADLPWNGPSFSDSEQVSFVVRLQNIIDGTILGRSGYLLRRGYLGEGRVEAIVERDGRVSSKYSVVDDLVTDYGGSEALGVVLASTIGNEDLLGEQTRKVFKDTGTTHLLVISGFQVGFIFFLIRSILRFFFVRWNFLLLHWGSEPLASLFALGCLTPYVLSVGFELSIARAFLVLFLITLGEVLGRRSSDLAMLQLSLVLCLLVWPFSILDAGFQLTFLAVLGLIVAGRVMKVFRDTMPCGARVELGAKSLAFAVMPWLFTAPVVLGWFGTISPAAPLFNLLSIALFSFVTTAGGLVALSVLWLNIPGGGLLMRAVLHLTENFVLLLTELRNLFDGSSLATAKLSGFGQWSLVVGFVLLDLLIVAKLPGLRVPSDAGGASGQRAGREHRGR